MGGALARDRAVSAMAPPPIGHVHLYQAVDGVGRRLRGADWLSVCCQDWLKYLVYANLVDDVIRTIAKGCEAGKLLACCKESSAGTYNFAVSRSGVSLIGEAISQLE